MNKTDQMTMDVLVLITKLMSAGKDRCVKQTFINTNAGRWNRVKLILADMGYIELKGQRVYITNKISLLSLDSAYNLSNTVIQKYQEFNKVKTLRVVAI